MHFTGSIDRYLIVVTESSHRLDMVSVIVGHEHMLHAGKTDAIVATGFLEASQPYSDIDK
jgi:hypothetical protein